MKRQRGLSLIGLIIVGGVLVFVAIVGMRCVPVYIEYFTIQKHLRELARSPDSASVKEIQNNFDKRAGVDDITSVQGKDLDITKTGNAVTLSVSYQRKVALFYNVSVLFDFDVSSGR